ncbi:AAA family ATPase [Eisenbergiella porci]|uniref:AAA family ATPase n=1 Tax=Eisenbergiella porci TaxID=2652274 RepID=UPI002A828EEB|nr:AAA family ATPase [Eisenbergiella porci]
MNHKILIRNFGPIKDAEIHLNNNFQILIGSQASGKSTLCKIVYFCQKIRDYTLDFLMNSEQFTKNHKNEYFNNYLKYMTKQFIGCFGTTKHMKRFRITYLFDEKKIEICLNNDGYVRFSFNDILKMEIYSLIEEASDMFLNRLNNEVASIMDNITAIGVMKRHLTEVLFSIFKNEAEIIYIPAERSLLATMSEQLHDISVSEMDLTMQEFVKLIRATKSQFGTKIPEMVQNYTKTVKGQINNSAVTHAYELIKKILKADYVNDSDGEKIYFDEHHWVKLMYGSSGQQEALWILMLTLIIILENRRAFVVIEEPEAHLFPIAQKDMISLIALMVNATDSRVIITTHSPYILTSSNILLYSEKVENNYRGEEKPVIPRSIRLSYHKFAAYKVENAADSLTSLMDENSHMISTDYIDKVSEITNNELEHLLDMEINDDM